MASSKKALFQEYRAKVKGLRAEFESTGNQGENHKTNQYGLFLLAQQYLRQYPELLDYDCSGRGLPANSYIWGSYLYGFTMDINIENKLKESGWFDELFDKKPI